MKTVIITCLMLYAFMGIAQNLVPNPSFEDTLFCPWAENQLPAGWLCFGNSPDYYHSCSSTNNVPNTPTGYHPAHSGNAMIGLFTYPWSGCSCPNYREFIGIPLNEPLVVGQAYYLSFFLNFGNYLSGWHQLAANKLGMKFSTQAFSETNLPDLDNSAHLYTDSIYSDSSEWVKVTGSFMADQAYTYIMIGNFFDDSHTDSKYIEGPIFGGLNAYYYIDDVCVSTDSTYNENWTAVNDISTKPNVINVFPNPFSDKIQVVSDLLIEEAILTDQLGRTIYTKKIDSNLIDLNVPFLSSGMFYLILTGHGFVYRKPLNFIQP